MGHQEKMVSLEILDLKDKKEHQEILDHGDKREMLDQEVKKET